MSETQRQKQKKLTRKHIIETAMKQYALNGMLKTKTSDISKAANLSHGTIFAHFKTHEALLIAVIEEFGQRISLRLHELTMGKCSVSDILKAHIKGLIEFEEFYTRLVIECRLLPEDARSTFISIQSTISFHFSEALQQDINSGLILELPNHMIFNGWIGLVHHYLVNGDLFSPNESVLKRYGQELVHHYMLLISANH